MKETKTKYINAPMAKRSKTKDTKEPITRNAKIIDAQ